ncbi:MAG: cofactor assembly of complex C subunit B, partial [Cyanobacteria bacterium J083]
LKDTVKEPNVLSFAGLVRPSFFLAIFLSLLAAIGLLSLSLVLALLYPAGGKLFLLLVLLAPLAGWFYWQKAERIEEIKLKIEALPLNEAESLTQVTIVAHRDEIIQLEQDKSFNFISNR